MSTSNNLETETSPRSEQAAGAGTFWEGRSGLVGPAVLAAFATYLLIGILVMEEPEGTPFPGPKFFPIILVVAGYIVAALLALAIFKNPETEKKEQNGFYRFQSDWAAVGWVVGGFLAFALFVPFLGWIIAGGILFWCVCRAFGSKRPVLDILTSLVVSSLVYLAFDVGLGLNLPSGILGGGF